MITRAVFLAILLALPSVQQTFRSGVDVVRVDALVTDGRKPIAGLAAADFELRDNGVAQSFELVAAEAMPLATFLVLDASGRRLIDGAILQAGQASPTFRSRRFRVTLGNGNVRLVVNGRSRTVPQTADGITQELTP